MIDSGKYEEALRLTRETNLKRAEICKQCGLNYTDFTYYLKSRYPELINKQKSLTEFNKNKSDESARRYKKAVKLYASSDLSCKEIAEKTGVSLSGFKTHIQKYHRDLMLARYDMNHGKRVAKSVKIRTAEQTESVTVHSKYRDAVEACDAEKYIDKTVTEIARDFGLSPTGLRAHLIRHYPEILQRREAAREKAGLITRRRGGVRNVTALQYAPAIELLNDPSVTIEQAAKAANVSYGGLREYYLRYYGKRSLVGRRVKDL